MNTANNDTDYIAAIYCRLSKDDDHVGDSVSIETQKLLLANYCKENGYPIYDIYVDDGYSGLNYNRPAFLNMLKAIENGQINLVITKDLSRLGRDYIQTGYYTDLYFSQKRVRYIAVNDGIDTLKDDNDIAPFKNILNDMYAKDLSKKIKTSKRQRAAKGYYISSLPPFGYKVDPMNHNHLIIDENVAYIVREIFDMYLAGNSTTAIAKALAEKGRISPCAYRVQCGDSRFFRYLKNGTLTRGWARETI